MPARIRSDTLSRVMVIHRPRPGKNLRGALAAFVFFSLACLLFGQPTNVSVRPESAWVRPVAWAPPARMTNHTSEGTHYLLYERQHHTGLKERYERVVMLMQNETGVQDAGNLSFGFDPSYQELVLHKVRIHRQGQSMERLDRAKIRIIQPETQLGGHVFTGEQSAVLFVEDLRVGDLLEYAFTIRGANPAIGDHFSTRLAVQSGIPVVRQRLRVVWASAQPLGIRPHLVELAPVKTALGGGTDHIWDFTNLTAIAWEDNTPVSFEPYPYLEFSDFASWARVVEWALPLYEVAATNLPAELEKRIEEWRRQAAPAEERARLALQFVQDELRYTGLELGPDSYRPAPPFETFEKRYGDCKGKVLLLCHIYRALGLQAWPALVNTYAREGIARRLPSPFAFNHVIVKLQIAGRIYWLDPTVSHQGGQLANRAVPPFGKALVIQPGVVELENILRLSDDRALQHVSSNFRITDYKAPVSLTVKTTHRSSSADAMRETLARTDKDKLSKDFLNFYARFYPGIESHQALGVSDDRELNLVTVTEHYRITNLWEINKALGQWEAGFYADSFRDLLTDPGTRLRQRPLRIPFPLRREQEIVVQFPDRDWRIPERREDIQHEAFSFRYHRKLNGDTLRLEYICETKVPEIPAASVASYLSKRGEMDDLLGDSLQRPDDTPGAAWSQLNWLMVVIAGFGFCATLAGCVWVWRRPRVEVSLPPALPDERRLQGLGGWLLLVGFGICASLVARLVQFGQNWDGYFLMNVWQSYALPSSESYHPLYGPLLIFEVLGNLLMFGVNLLLIGLFFSKRRLFPTVYIALMVSNTLFLLVDEIVGNQIPFVKEQAGNASSRELIRSIGQGVLWCTYMLKSRRVRLTFVR